MFHPFRVNAVSLVSLAAKASCGGGVFGCVVFFLFVGVLVFCLVWCGFPVFAFASLHAFVPSLTGAQRTDSSPASKKNHLANFSNEENLFWRCDVFVFVSYCGHCVYICLGFLWRGASWCHVAISLNSLKKMMALLRNVIRICCCRCVLQLRASRLRNLNLFPLLTPVPRVSANLWCLHRCFCCACCSIWCGTSFVCY